MMSPTPADQVHVSKPGWRRLSGAQQWEVARIAGACVVTLAGLASALWMLNRTPVIVADHDREVHAAEAQPRVVVRTADVEVTVSTPPLAQPRRLRPGGSSATRTSAPARPRMASAASRTPQARPGEPAADALPRRVARFITGDGRYEVRPFPTVPERH